MRRIINSKAYDTETAELVVDATPLHAATASRGDFAWESTKLYRSPKGQFFLAGEGGATSRWARSVSNGSVGGDGIKLISVDEARSIAEREKLNESDYERFFGQPDEG